MKRFSLENSRKILIHILLFNIFICISSEPVFSQIPAIDSSAILTPQIPEKVYSVKDTVITAYDTIIIVTHFFIRKKDTLITANQLIPFTFPPVVAGKDTIVEVFFRTRLHNDTVFTLNERVLSKIEKFSEKDNWFSKLFRNMVVFEDKYVPEDTLPKIPINNVKTEDRYMKYEDWVIGEIKIDVLNALGYSINDRYKRPRSLLEKGGNAIRIKTYKNIIRNKLLFKPGDCVNSVNIAESERLLRQTNYIYDALILLEPRTNTDTVDIYVRSQDLWSLSAGGAYDPASSATDLSTRDVNFLGLGHQFDNAVKLNSALPSGLNYEGMYFINNIYRSQSQGQVFFRYQNGEKRMGTGVNREFLSSSIVWAGGVNFFRNEVNTIPSNDTTLTRIGYNIQDLWIGYALQGRIKRQFQGNRIFLTGRFIGTDYFIRPEERSPNDFNNNQLYLLSAGYFNRKFLKDNYIFQLGRTEDIPTGSMLTIIGGIKTERGIMSYYRAVQATISQLFTKVGYIYAGAGVGSFLRNGAVVDGSFYTKVLYYSPLIKLSKWNMRSFLGIRTYSAFNNVSSFKTNINRENGLRGLNSDFLTGTRKLVINFEKDFFPSINLLGFRFGLLFFADWAWVGNGPGFINKNSFQHGYGIGVRMRNENLIFSMVQVLLGIYPNATKVDQVPLQFLERTRYFFNFNDLEFSRAST